jgi:hypothetical protein
VAGPPQDRPIVWAARGSYARERDAEPVELPGYFVPLEAYRELAPPLTLEALREADPQIRGLVDRLKSKHRKPLYFPFELSDRPIRLMQGYAFKLPADFITAFPTLKDACGRQGAAILGPDPQYLSGARAHTSAASLATVVAAIDARAGDYAIGTLQTIRRGLRGRVATQRIFGARSVHGDYAFHSGGQDELQFNVGNDLFEDGQLAFRVGVGFSLETSRSLPSIDPIVPKIARFNAFMRENPETFSDLAMWHWRRERSADYAPRPIDPELVRPGVFIFLGARQPPSSINIEECLYTFDRLLPLYRYVEGADPRPLVDIPVSYETTSLTDFRLELGITAKPSRWKTASTRERQLDVYLRHNELQERLRDRLAAQYGATNVWMEVPIGNRLIDLVVKNGDELWFFEVKTGTTARACLREAIGQLLDYALWSDRPRPTRLIVVGEMEPDPSEQHYIERLNSRFPIPLSYEAQPLG